VIAYEVRIKLNSGGGAECHVNQSHLVKESE